MSGFGQFYLDKEKDIVLELDSVGDQLHYTLRTPHHHSGNLITNLATLCHLPLSVDENGLKIIRGIVPCYVDGQNRRVYIFRLNNTKVANIYTDGRVEMKASIPAISKTLMSQTKHYRLSEAKTIVKTYILSECKFETDLHTHMNGNLIPEILIALGIRHQIRYPLYYIKKLQIRCTPDQTARLMAQREVVSRSFSNSPLSGKYLERRIDDYTFINFADLILSNTQDAAYNIDQIVTSLSVPKDGQAVFANLEKTYLYRYVFTKGERHPQPVELTNVESIPNDTVVRVLRQMLADEAHPVFSRNSLFEDELLWIARQYASHGIRYTEITDTALSRKEEAIIRLAQIHRVMPAVTEETGVLIRFLAGIRRIPLTIVRDRITPNDYLISNLHVIRAIADDPYVAGADIIGEEINDILELRQVIHQLVSITLTVPDFVIRIHAGENDSLRNNVSNSLKCVRDALLPGQPMPQLRIGHGLYTCNLRSAKGERLLRELRESRTVLEFQITSNVRLNNLSRLDQHPLKQYLHAGILCVQGTDGGAMYGTDSIDEELALEKLLDLQYDDLYLMRQADRECLNRGLSAFQRKNALFAVQKITEKNITDRLSKKLEQAQAPAQVLWADDTRVCTDHVLSAQLCSLPDSAYPVIVAGGSFNNSNHHTRLRDDGRHIIDLLLRAGDPSKIIFVIGHRLTGYEGYLVKMNQGRFRIHCIVPTMLSQAEAARLRRSGVTASLSIESSGMGLYKSFAYEIFKRRPSTLLVFDGNSAAVNLIQEAKNGRFMCHILLDHHSRILMNKAKSLQGYVQVMNAASVSDVLTEFSSVRELDHSGSHSREFSESSEIL